MNYFLSSTTYFSEHEDSPIFIGCKEGETPAQIEFNQLNFDSLTIVTFNSTILTDYCRNKHLCLPKNIIDILQLFKLLYAEHDSIKYYKLSELEQIWIVFRNFIEVNELKKVIKVLGFSPNQIIETNSKDKLIEFNNFLQKVYIELGSQLKCKEEFQRYFEVEKPLNELLCQRQFHGICIDNKLYKEKIEHLTSKINSNAKQLRYNYNILGLNDLNGIRRTLESENLYYLLKTINTKYFWNFVKYGFNCNAFLNLLYNSYRLEHDKRNLLKVIIEDEEKIYPLFDCCGTVTSRILVRKPLIQQLKKQSRDIFVAKSGFTLLYVDYSQFEPGILASLSNDETLIKHYNQEDLYNSLSIEIFDNRNYRSLCKTIFISFMYGMSTKRMEFLIKDFFKGEKDAKASDINTFFSKYKSIVPYKSSLETLALKEKKMCSCLGNYRYIRNSSDIKILRKAKRWILNQKIQGTASLILKTAILTCGQDPEIEFLIPMHDAALFQVPIDKAEEKKNFITQAFKDAFLKYCPTILPKILFKNFTEQLGNIKELARQIICFWC